MRATAWPELSRGLHSLRFWAGDVGEVAAGANQGGDDRSYESQCAKRKWRHGTCSLRSWREDVVSQTQMRAYSTLSPSMCRTLG